MMTAPAGDPPELQGGLEGTFVRPRAGGNQLVEPGDRNRRRNLPITQPSLTAREDPLVCRADFAHALMLAGVLIWTRISLPFRSIMAQFKGLLSVTWMIPLRIWQMRHLKEGAQNAHEPHATFQ